MKMKGLFCFFLLLNICSYYDASRTIKMESQKSTDIDQHLKRINKTPVKSIKSPDGDIIDCVDIYKQPAFDHPLLRNHSIQMRPSYIPEEGLSKNIKFGNKDKGIHQLWHKNGSRCPEGTIPIRRTTKDDLLRAGSIERFGKKNPESINDMHEHATLVFDGKYYGGRGALTIWEPPVQQSDEFSLSRVFIIDGSLDTDFSSVEVGWQVNPSVYGDFKTRLYIYWTGDGRQSTGCYDLRCPGFVQTNRDFVLGSIFDPVSYYDGDQSYILFTIFKNEFDGNWWLAYGRAEIVGYWPISLFTHLHDGSTQIRVGGEVMNRNTDGKHTTTGMGSGHFSGEGFARSGLTSNIMVINTSYKSQNPISGSYYISASKGGCYDGSALQYSDGELVFYHGGPGRNVNCP